ncbi:ATP-binding protein [Pedobacter sp. Du54]|uniref:sensor histidine kinase n=1 Tax=Pedobacter anseongensis TaxID=3133439 RepID=UPI0030B679CC
MKRQFNEQLLKSQLEIQEMSFNAISMEIHDNVGQTLSLLKMQLNIMGQQQVLEQKLLAEAKNSVSKAMGDLRDIAKGLNTERIEMTSILDLVSDELAKINNTGGISVAIEIENKEIEIKTEKKLILFRIIQECLQNIIKHADATEVKVLFRYPTDQLNIVIIDNGKGFNPEKVLVNPKGLGLKNILNRAHIIGGSAIIESVIKQGTIVSIFSPYE